MKKRHELKYMINEADHLTLRSRFSKLFSQDTHVGESGEYHTTTLLGKRV